MPRKINTVGGGAKTNENGLHFEQQTSLEEAIKETGFISVNEKIVYIDTEKIGRILVKHELYKKFLEPQGINVYDYWSKKMLPDDCFVNFQNKTIYIIEKKFQHDSGSVDEKLQTCDFKLKQYKKLFKAVGYETKYIYLLCDWFKRDEYRDVLKYIQDVGCDYYFNKIPLSVLSLPEQDKNNK